MEYSVRYIAGDPNFDSLEVIKLICDSSVDINNRVYGQAQLGRNDELLFARILSFESEPTCDSSVALELELADNTVSVRVSFNGSAELLLNGKAVSGKLSSYIISGEDLQGEYWGAVLMLPLDFLLEHFSLSKNLLPAKLCGNISRRNSNSCSCAVLNEKASIILMAAK